jgi:predicted 3-demethylubiquinone-9 3-methyltransferase (glyoxalase superfamily)
MHEQRIIPCLWFDDQAETAAGFYAATLPDAFLGASAWYPSAAPNPSGKPPGSVMSVDFTVAGQRFTALNGGPAFALNPSISFFLHVGSEQEVDALYRTLHEGGQDLMPLDAYPWSPRYAWVMDRFGVSWQVMTATGVTRSSVAPSLLFTGALHGRAREAVEAYVAAFPDSRIDHIDRHEAGEDLEGTVKYAGFTLAGQALVAMDGGPGHAFTFNEGVSLQVMCENQDEVDHFWRTLSEGGEEGPCGWVKDRFGVSWQIVPEAMSEWMTHPDAVARDRAFQAMLGMKKLDIAGLQRALTGD